MRKEKDEKKSRHRRRAKSQTIRVGRREKEERGSSWPARSFIPLVAGSENGSDVTRKVLQPLSGDRCYGDKKILLLL